jgi:hypothetical protein
MQLANCTADAFEQGKPAFFAIQAPALRANVPALQLQQSFDCQISQPWVNGHRLLTEELRQSARSFHQRFLNNVRGIDADHQPPVHADGDHLPQLRTMLDKQLLAGASIAAAGQREQLLRITISVRHDRVPYD